MKDQLNPNQTDVKRLLELLDERSKKESVRFSLCGMAVTHIDTVKFKFYDVLNRPTFIQITEHSFTSTHGHFDSIYGKIATQYSFLGNSMGLGAFEYGFEGIAANNYQKATHSFFILFIVPGDPKQIFSKVEIFDAKRKSNISRDKSGLSIVKYSDQVWPREEVYHDEWISENSFERTVMFD